MNRRHSTKQNHKT